MTLKFRTLYADEIECRVDQVSADKTGCSLLLYKDARCDMNILDETVGPMEWMRQHVRDNANCVVSIWDRDKKQWISKEDTGTDSNTEAEKGRASDSFKRACVNWGIGRELYTAPFIWINGSDIEWKKNTKGKEVPKDRFFVREIDYDEKRRINKLVICKSKGVVVYQMCSAARKAEPKAEQPEAKPVICPKCGNTIIREKIKGKMREPEEILKACGGMCIGCYTEIKQKKDLVVR